MARKRPSPHKRQREYDKRQRELKKSEKAAEKRQRRENRDVTDELSPATEADDEIAPRTDGGGSDEVA